MNPRCAQEPRIWRARRPDLLGLEAGYRAQDQRYRAALLAQFPALNVGFTRGRDNAGVYSSGIGITLSLPVFNRQSEETLQLKDAISKNSMTNINSVSTPAAAKFIDCSMSKPSIRINCTISQSELPFCPTQHRRRIAPSRWKLI